MAALGPGRAGLTRTPSTPGEGPNRDTRSTADRPDEAFRAVERIVSGGQTGADRAALDAAHELGVATGGWVPRGRRAEDGAIPERYQGLVEADSEDYALRTRLNVRDADATVVFHFGPPTGGSALTARIARSLGKPLLCLDLSAEDRAETVARLRRWLAITRPRVLNVAGSRASQAPQIAEATAAVLRDVLRRREGEEA